MSERKFKFVGDRENATYRHEIFLNDGKVDVLDGYSKHKNHDEPLDKEKCLVGYISRIINNGYLSKSQYMVFYKHRKTGKENDDILVELHGQGFKLHGIAETMFDLKNYLNEVYTKIHKGQEFTEVKPISAKSFSPDLFKIKGQFKSQAELDNYCEGLKTKGVPYGRVQGFYYAYLKVHPLTSVNEASEIKNIENLVQSNLGHMIRR